jgi:hypothetical protein
MPFVAVPFGQKDPGLPVQSVGCAAAPVQKKPGGHTIPFVAHDAGQY